MLDLHCHILPGLDDGPKTMDESLAMCRMATDDGITTIVATPHRGNPAGHTDGPQVLEAVKELNKELKKHNIPLKILPGQEVHIQKDLIDDMDKGLALTINNNKKYILLELPFTSVPFYVHTVLAELKKKKIITIIAHPERNAQLRKDKRLLKRLMNEGALYQITAGSLLGEFGKSVQEATVYMLKKGFVSVMASDAHSVKRPPVLSGAVSAAVEIVGVEKAKALVEGNPAKIIEGD